MTYRFEKLDAMEVFALVFIICGSFTLLVINVTSNYESPVIRQPKADIELMPARGHCAWLTGEAYVDCMLPGSVLEEQK